MKLSPDYKHFAHNKAYLKAAKELLSRVEPDAIVKQFELEDILDKLKAWEKDSSFHMDTITNAARSSK